jgi:Family of unknown function (DUF5372)
LGEGQLFRVTHPFHPWCGRQFEVFNYRHNWGEYRVWFFDEQDELRSLPATWTDVIAPDLAVTLGAGRVSLRAADLLRLARLLQDLDRASVGRQP